jgi:hypothetical protein
MRASPSRLIVWFDKLNGPWHKWATRTFMAIVLLHWSEHVVQAYQIWVLGWPRPKALGFLGYLFPWLVRSEALHYGYAIIMLIGLLLLRPGFRGRARMWWDVAIVIQFWHHIEHGLLLAQSATNHNLFGAKVPTSVAQLLIQRVELHLFYNALVTIPMLIAMYYHLFPPRKEREVPECDCAIRKPAELSPALQGSA